MAAVAQEFGEGHFTGLRVFPRSFGLTEPRWERAFGTSDIREWLRRRGARTKKPSPAVCRLPSALRHEGRRGSLDQVSRCEP